MTDTLFIALAICAGVCSVLAFAALIADILAHRAWRRSIEEALRRPQKFAYQVPPLKRQYGGRP